MVPTAPRQTSSAHVAASNVRRPHPSDHPSGFHALFVARPVMETLGGYRLNARTRSGSSSSPNHSGKTLRVAEEGRGPLQDSGQGFEEMAPLFDHPFERLHLLGAVPERAGDRHLRAL